MSAARNATWAVLGAAVVAAAGVLLAQAVTDTDENSAWHQFLRFVYGEDLDKSSKSPPSAPSEGGTQRVENIKLDEVVKILNNIRTIQKETQTFLKDLVIQLSVEPKSLAEVYEIVERDTPADPLASDGISMKAFDDILTRFENEPTVNALIESIMSNDITPSCDTDRELSTEKIIEIHQFMHSELVKLVQEAKAIAASGKKQDSRYATMASQAVVGSKVLKNYGVEPQDVEACLMTKYSVLQYNHEFLKVSVQMQAAMGELMVVNGGDA
eukprot:GHVH01017494.1.p1 GENE.GHVH01017494.1~~GHVH01017494.1.p1  ORF type:complete len:270 (-),score=45.68 GHVH01017494.1:70-879(-)